MLFLTFFGPVSDDGGECAEICNTLDNKIFPSIFVIDHRFIHLLAVQYWCKICILEKVLTENLKSPPSTVICTRTACAVMYILWMTGQCWTERKCKTLHFNWSGASQSSSHRAKEVFWVCPYKIRAEKLFPPNWETRSWYCRWF